MYSILHIHLIQLSIKIKFSSHSCSLFILCCFFIYFLFVFFFSCNKLPCTISAPTHCCYCIKFINIFNRQFIPGILSWTPCKNANFIKTANSNSLTIWTTWCNCKFLFAIFIWIIEKTWLATLKFCNLFFYFFLVLLVFIQFMGIKP